MFLNPLHEFDAVPVWQVHVGQAEVGGVLFQQFPGAGEVGCREGCYAHPGEGDLKQLPDVRFIINDQRCVCGHLVSSVPCRCSSARYPPAPVQIIRPG